MVAIASPRGSARRNGSPGSGVGIWLFCSSNSASSRTPESVAHRCGGSGYRGGGAIPRTAGTALLSVPAAVMGNDLRPGSVGGGTGEGLGPPESGDQQQG